MNIQQFWSHIEKIKHSKIPAKDIENILKKLPIEEIISFDFHLKNLHLCAFRLDLYFAACMLIGWCDEELFSDFIFALITKGKKIYESAIQFPDSVVALANDANISDDSFGFSPSRIYKKLTGNEIPKSFFEIPGTYMFDDGTVLGEEREWDFHDKEERKKHLPKLSEFYYGQKRLSYHYNGPAIFQRARYSKDFSERVYELCVVKGK